MKLTPKYNSIYQQKPSPPRGKLRKMMKCIFSLSVSSFAIIIILYYYNSNTLSNIHSTLNDIQLVHNDVDQQTSSKPFNSDNIDQRTSSPHSSYNNNDDGVCEMMQSTMESLDGSMATANNAIFMWYYYIEKIIDVTQKQLPSIFTKDNEKLTKDEKLMFRKWIMEMMPYLTPQVFMKSVKHMPQTNDMKRIFVILEKRIKWFINSGGNSGNRGKDIPPPLKILVMGGSVTKGHFCEVNPINEETYDASSCNWVVRLEMLINDILGFHVVTIVNVAAGGMSSDIGARIYRFKMFPKELLPQPDIVINAYSTNDMHYATRASAGKLSSSSVTVNGLEDDLFRINEDFIRAVIATSNSDPCHKPPMLIYLSDHLGNFVKGVQDTMIFNRVIDQLSNYYDFMYISYADAVRQIALSKRDEYWFSPKWVRFVKGEEISTDQIHFGMGGHLAMTWVMAFNFLHAVVTHCNSEQILENYRNIMYIPDSSLDRTLNGRPGPIPENSPPAMTSGLQLDDVFDQWKPIFFNQGEPQTCKKDESFPCVFNWMLGTDGIQRELPQLMEKKSVDVDGWAVEDETLEKKLAKRGWAAIGGKSSSFTIRLKKVKNKIQGLHFFVMHSYGKKWNDSVVKVSVFGANETDNDYNHLADLKMEGFHDSETSVTYPYEINLRDEYIAKGGKIRIVVTLISGVYFKFTGMAFCSNF